MFGGGGGNPPPYPFPKPPSSTTGSEQPPASATTVFGQATGAPGTFGQPSTLFGHTPTTAGWGAPAGSTPAPGGAVFGNNQSIGSNPFGQQPTPSAGAPTSMPTFGSQNQPPSSSSVFGQSESSGAAFGQPPSTAAPAFSLSAGTTFGSAAGPGSAGFQPSTAPVFGATLGTRKSSSEAKPSSGAAHSVAASTFADQAGSTIRSLFGAGGTDSASSAASAGTSLFGKGAGGADPAGGSLFGKAPDGAATADGPSLFGKAPGAAGSATSSSAAGASLFGKTTGGTGLFGKQKAASDSGVDAPPAAPLFGKTSSETTGLFGKPKRTPSADTDETDAGPLPSSRPTGAAPGLFGKTASGVDSAGAGAPGLFGKAAEGRSAGSAPALFGKEGGSEPAAAPSSGRLRSVFTQPDGPAPTSKRRPATSLTEASRRSLARTGLFGKPPEARTVAKSPVTGPAGPRVQRLSSAEELQQVTSLLCTDVPEGNNDRTILTRHFSKFGQVVKVTCNKAKNTASIHFADHAAADAAKRRGARVHPKLPPMSLYFRRPVKSAAAEPARRPLPPLDDDVSDELRNMAGTGDTRDPPRRAELPPEPKPRRAEAPPEPKARRAPAAATATVPAPSAVPAAAAAAPAAAVNVSELRAVLRQPAASASDRFRVLDARDKLQRAALRREGPARSGPLVGTCPDMCPEKERYMREEKHQISGQYERDRDRQGGFEMDHRLAVKQYSRSSADQEEPLPHELRTPAALLRTMDYLVTHVTDAETRDTGDWFHFIWDRTRGIRKDITQQQLTDQVSVGLVEKCARFHVHCAAALCELSRDMFDQKINNENLTKCLQTLKHMYHDLSLKGVRCEREAEFRAYDILLNLNQGDTLREAQTYSDEVRESPEVQAALRLYVALSSNNYVRFFKLVRRAGYLASCLLQRYFNQVRTRALDVITRTYCPAKAVVEFPLTQLQEMLGFESEQECASALRQHGIESEEGTAFLERVQFQVPDTPPELRRCPTLIDAKRELSIGQAIQGGPLPADPLPSYRPHDSFDAHGVLRRTAWDAQDQGGVEPAAEAAPPPADDGELVTEVVVEETRRQAEQLLAAAVAARQMCAQLFQATVDEVVKEMVRSVSQLELAEARRLQEEQKRLQEQRRREAEERRARELQEQERARRDQEMKDRLSSVLTETLIAEVCLDETADIAEQEMLNVQAKHSAVAVIHLRLWTEGADRLARRTAEEVLAECRRQRQALIQTLTEIGHRLTLCRMLDRWLLDQVIL
ncbi:germinal-center associated nuclear protein-like [Amphibalanus amphitrite]|uniref:germinal-center associated nuclear protein-like n=1 Tax=Amphibalanus amphitrite TaxID=1232801 RepID=UPI001C8FBC60|nr:germinal-center associated nuclear protein-like [Amphibalanus amphitrite]